MTEDDFSWDKFFLLPIVGIVRNLSIEEVVQMLPLYEQAGLTTLEITMNTPGAAGIIQVVRQNGGQRLNVGAGTVCNKAELDMALEAGAQFIVAPVVNEEVIRSCVDMKIPVFPGAYTPTEIYNAWNLGAEMIKVFPATSLGHQYIKDLKGPLNHIKLLPTGGIHLDNCVDFLKAGATGLGLGSQLFQESLIREKNWSSLFAHFLLFVEKVKNFKSGASGLNV
jgi:2-dehydro-3-deoxyphosphogluconate aldolase / (4S)-4-hydroxy-2-oxoglutarate aldolase